MITAKNLVLVVDAGSKMVHVIKLLIICWCLVSGKTFMIRMRVLNLYYEL
jgi:hypothetical protein